MPATRIVLARFIQTNDSSVVVRVIGSVIGVLAILVSCSAGCTRESPAPSPGSPIAASSGAPATTFPPRPATSSEFRGPTGDHESSPSTSTRANSETKTKSLPWELDEASIESRLARDLRYLASDELGGRGPFSEGLERASEYIANQFQAADLDMRVVAGSPFQVFRTQVKSQLAPGSTLSFGRSGSNESDRLAVAAADFTPLSLTAPGPFDAGLAFVGYGVTAPESSYDDYAGIDATGRIVVILRHMPATFEKTDGGGARPLSPHALLTRKAENAFFHGAKGVIFVTDEAHLPHTTGPAAPASAAGASADQASDPSSNGDKLLGFQVDGKLAKPAGPVLHCRRAVIDRLFESVRRSRLAQLEQEIGDSNRGRSFVADDIRVVGNVAIERQVRSLKNVIGAIPGRGPLANETVIVGAHYDHLGLGGASSLAPWTRAPHNGADDNASGTAALLEIARQASLRRGESCRRLLFVAFSAEEMGLVGSERFVGNPPVPLADVVTMVNLDMVGRLRNERLIVSGTGTARDFPSMLRRLASPHQFQLKLDPSGYGPSDHATFFGRGIPVLHFFTGLHEDYHRPSDDVDRINVSGLRRIAGLATDVVLELAQQEKRPERVRSSDADLLAELGLGSETRTSSARSRSKPSRRGLGINVRLDEDGQLCVEKVHAGSLASAAQLREGDVLLRVGDVPVRSIDQLRGTVGEQLSAGRLSLTVKRGSTELSVEIDAKSN